jgi:hypothetical protein
LSGINFVLHRAHLTTIRGRLIAPPEAMRPFLQIATFNGLGGAIATSDWPLNRDHSFVISGLAKGSYELFAGYQMGDRHYAVNMPLELGSEDISGLELRPAPPSSLAGRVRVEGGNVSPSRLQVSLNSGSRTTEAAWVHEDGNFVLPDVTPGAYIVYLNGLDGVYLKAVYWGPGGHGAELVDQHIDLTKGVPANTELSIVVGADPGQIIGTVRDADLKAVIGAWVVLASPAAADRRHAFFAISDQAGRYTFNNLPPGDYKLYSWRDQIDSGRAEHDATYLAPVESEGQDVHVDPHSQQALDTKVIDKRPI